MKTLTTLFLFLLLGGAAFAQAPGAPARGKALPGGCSLGDIFFLTVTDTLGNVPGLYAATSAGPPCVWTVIGSGSGAAGAQYAAQYNSNGSGGFAGVAPPATAGMYNVAYAPPTAAAVAPVASQVGFNTFSIGGSTSTFTLTYNDVDSEIDHDILASASVTVTLPVPTTAVASGGLGNPSFAFTYCNASSHVDTLTPTTWTIQAPPAAAGATLTVNTNYCYRVSADPLNTTNWLAHPTSIPVTASATYGWVAPSGYSQQATGQVATANKLSIYAMSIPESVVNVNHVAFLLAAADAVNNSAVCIYNAAGTEIAHTAPATYAATGGQLVATVESNATIGPGLIYVGWTSVAGTISFSEAQSQTVWYGNLSFVTTSGGACPSSISPPTINATTLLMSQAVPQIGFAP